MNCKPVGRHIPIKNIVMYAPPAKLKDAVLSDAGSFGRELMSHPGHLVFALVTGVSALSGIGGPVTAANVIKALIDIGVATGDLIYSLEH